MHFRNFLISIIKNIIVLVVVTLIFSTVAFDVPGLIKDLFKDIFQYASPEMQKEVVSKLTVACSGLEDKDYGALQQEMAKGPVQLDFTKIGAFCKNYNAGKINDKEFFFSVIGSAFPEKFELPKVNALERYNSIMEFLNKNKIVYFVILVILFILLYLMIMNIRLFISTLTGISFSMGILILLPYVAIISYDKFVGIDTTPILATIFGGNFSVDAKAIISIVLLLILRTYSSFIILLGILFLGAGIAGKVYSWRLKRQSRKTETKTDKKPEKEEQKKAKTAKEERIKLKKDKERDEDADEAYKHRDRSTKEILDELEDMHRKKTKKD